VALLLGLALAGTLRPNLARRSEADGRRRSFNDVLGAFLDLRAVNLAAGRPVEGALDTAAGAGEGWAFGEHPESTRPSLPPPCWPQVATSSAQPHWK
jgi:hypothetical protein